MSSYDHEQFFKRVLYLYFIYLIFRCIGASPLESQPVASLTLKDNENHVYVDIAQMSNPVFQQHSIIGNDFPVWPPQLPEGHVMNELKDSNQIHLPMNPSQL